jgi:prepilin-type N-terminal cleavage/methylation domain-containing protein
MRNQGKHIQAMTLTELLVVISVMAIMLAVAAPVAKKLSESLGESTGAKSIISAAMSNARAIAVREQKYAGVRFQQDNSGKQYLILIIHNPDPKDYTTDNRFGVIQGKKPMALPDDVGVMDGVWVQRTFKVNTVEMLNAVDKALTDPLLDDTSGTLQDGKNKYFWDACTFSIVFSPSGKMVSHTVSMCNKDGVYDISTNNNVGSMDKVFNKQGVVDGTRIAYIDAAGVVRERNRVPADTDIKPMFYQDDYDEVYQFSSGAKNLGIAPETSRNNFILFSKKELAKKPSTQRWSGYLSGLNKEFINPYTGELIKK